MLTRHLLHVFWSLAIHVCYHCELEYFDYVCHLCGIVDIIISVYQKVKQDISYWAASHLMSHWQASAHPQPNPVSCLGFVKTTIPGVIPTAQSTSSSFDKPFSLCFSPGLEGLELHHIVVNTWEHGVDSEQNVVLISIASVMDPSLAPKGKHTLHAYLPATEPFEIWQNMKQGTPEYEQLKKERSQVLWKAVERVIPDIRKRTEIEMVRLFTAPVLRT